MKTSEKILTFSALFISCLALVVSIVQTRILQKQSQAAVWPRIDYLDSTSSEHYELYVSNQGVGPAIISNIEYTYKDSTFNSVPKLIGYLGGLKVIADENKNTVYPDFTYLEIIKGRVIKPGEDLKIYNARDSFTIQLGWEFLKDMNIRIDYCSIYDDCWSMQDNVYIKL